MKKLEVHVGGVPEHFNLPWRLAVEEKLFEKERLKVHWHDYPGGTGAMVSDLNMQKLDIALLLTEGALAGIAREGAFRLAGYWVTSPLIWGIHTHNSLSVSSLADLQHKTIAISRPGSGSQLMAYVLAKREAWPLDSLKFEIVQDLEGARTALAEGRAQLFLWEKFMTKPLVDSGEWQRVGELPTPWPSFVVAIRKTLIQQHDPELECLLKIVRERAQQLATDPKASARIAKRYNFQEEDASIWLQSVRCAPDDSMSVSSLHNVLDTLNELKLLAKPLNIDDCTSSLCKLS
jgi:sulfonate transport system substrate-binding protein